MSDDDLDLEVAARMKAREEIGDFRAAEWGGASDEIRAEAWRHRIMVEIENPWSGDSETGFGETGRINLTKEQAIALAEWLLAAAEMLVPVSDGKGV